MEKVLALDFGTSSVSAVVAEKHANGKFFVCDVWRYSHDISENQNPSRIIFKNSKKIFEEASKLYPKIDNIAVGFSQLFCHQKNLSGEFTRDNPINPISEEEIVSAVLNLENKYQTGLKLISHDILETKIDGYFVDGPIGHKGENLEIGARFIFVSPRLKEHFEEIKDNFFPASKFVFFCDFSILKKSVSRFFSPKKEFEILDIGGNASFFSDYMFSFGLRGVENKFGPTKAGLRMFSSGHLDYPQERIAKKFLDNHSNILKEIIFKKRCGQVFLTGGGANFSNFENFVKENLTSELQKLEAQSFDGFFSKLSPLSGGQDAVLTALICNYVRV